MVLIDVTNKKHKMANKQPDGLHNTQASDESSNVNGKSKAADESSNGNEKSKAAEQRAGDGQYTGVNRKAFKTETSTPFKVFEDEIFRVKLSAGDDDAFTHVKEKLVEGNDGSPAETSTAHIFTRRKQISPPTSLDADKHVEETAEPGIEEIKPSSSGSQKKTRKSRRVAIGFPSPEEDIEKETQCRRSEKILLAEEEASECEKLTETPSFDIETAIQKLPVPSDLPDHMSADQIADIDKLFDSLASDFSKPAGSSVLKTVIDDQKGEKSKRRKSARRTSFILPCHMSQPDVPLLEQTDTDTPIHEKQFRLPSSGEDSLTPATITPVVQPGSGDAKISSRETKKNQKSRKVAKAKTKKRVKSPVPVTELSDFQEVTEKSLTSEGSGVNDTEPVIESPALQACRPSKAKRRRRSADSFIIDAQEVEKTPSPNSLLADLPKISARRSNRIKRRSIEMFRHQLRKDAGEESPGSSSDGRDNPEAVNKDCDQNAKSSQEVASSEEVRIVAPMETDSVSLLSTNFPADLNQSEELQSGPSSAPVTPDSANVSFNSSIDQSPATTPSGSKPKSRRGKRKRETSVEDIYRNKLWRTQMPKEKNWETIFEEPKIKKGQEEYQSIKKFKRFCNFDDFYNQNRLKRRRQKALKRGWKPLTKKREEKAGKLVEEKILALDQELIIEEDQPNTSIAETLAMLGEPLDSTSSGQTETTVSDSPIKSPVAHTGVSVSKDKNTPEKKPPTDSSVVSVVVTACETDTSEIDSSHDNGSIEYLKVPPAVSSTSAEQNEKDFFTPVAEGPTKSSSSTAKSKTSLSFIDEEEESDDMFFTPMAQPLVKTSTNSKSEITASPNSSGGSSDSLSISKTPARPSEVADVSGVYSLSP